MQMSRQRERVLKRGWKKKQHVGSQHDCDCDPGTVFCTVDDLFVSLEVKTRPDLSRPK